MGYGIKFLQTNSPFLPSVLRGEDNKWGSAECEKQKAEEIYEASNEVFRLGHHTIMFISTCQTLFRILEGEDEDLWDNVYVWKSKYLQMEWSELKEIVEPLVKDLEDKEEAMKVLEVLCRVSYISHTFVIN